MQPTNQWLSLPGIGRCLQRCAGMMVLAFALASQAAETNPTATPGTNTNPPPRIAPPGSWVVPHFFDPQSAVQIESGMDARLLLTERQINAAENETFVHTARQMLTPAGVQNRANIAVNYNPSYETLTFHWIRLWRGAQHLERLNPAAIKVVQQEREMDDYILNGEQTAMLVLDDVRVGDIIDCAYSSQGANPVFAGHFSDAIPLETEQPAERWLTRVLWPAGRHLYARPHGWAAQPVAAGKDPIEYTWDMRQVPALTLEDYLPTWCDPQPWLQLSEFKTWAEVDQWALALFKVASPLSPELTRQIAQWRQLPGQEQQILAALRFVQEDVRYFGIEIGVSGEKPGDPSVVFGRRFGDCKDKSFLFVSILRALGIPSSPVLVNATYGRAIATWQPSAGLFDHCIAMAVCDGQTWWLDPTMNYQRGPLAAHYLPAYECGLVIAPGTTGLTAIPSLTGQPRTTTTEYFTLRGRNEPADLKVVTLAEGRDAERLRQIFAETKHGDIEKTDTHFYASLYPGIKMTSPVVLEDDEAQNRIQTTETYSWDQAWSQPAKAGKLHCDLYASIITDLLRKPVDLNRKYPLAIRFPQHQFLRMEVTLPQPWPAESFRKDVLDPAFVFRKASRCAGSKLVVEYEYQALADAVAPGLVSQYDQHVNQASELLGETVIWR